MYRNQNAGDPTKFTYVPDLTRQAATAGSWRIASVRLTMQPTSRNRFNVFWDEQHPCQGVDVAGQRRTAAASSRTTSGSSAARQAPPDTFGLATATQAPEILELRRPRPRVSARDAGDLDVAVHQPPAPRRRLRHLLQSLRRPGDAGQSRRARIPRMVEQCAGAAPANAVPGACAHGISNLTFGSQDWSSNQGFVLNWRGSASYVTGAHSMKFGYQAAYHRINQSYFSNDNHLTYRLNYGVPNLLTLDLKPFEHRAADALGGVLRAGTVDAAAA